MRILLVDNYDSYTWNLFHLVWRVSGVRPIVLKNDEMSAEQVLQMAFTHIIISPGPGTPEALSDFGICGHLLKEAQVPCLGVCLGHQGLASSFGGTIIRAPEIMHGRLSSIAHDNSAIFKGIPQNFKAVRYHSLAVSEPIPPELRVIARSESSVIMGLAHRTRPQYGVQFHPESIETEYGDLLIKNFLEVTSDAVSIGWQNAGKISEQMPQHDCSEETEANKKKAKQQIEPLGVDIDAANLFARAFANDVNAFWLDSARKAYGMGRYSFLGSAEVLVRYFARSNIVEEINAGNSHRSVETIFEYMARQMNKVDVSSKGPFPFHGGFVGYLGYGVKGINGIGRYSRSQKPDAEFIRVDRYAVVDHETDEIFLTAVDLTAEEFSAWCDNIRALARTEIEIPVEIADASVTSSIDYSTYNDHFNEVQDWLRRGDSYQSCYTYQMRVRSSNQPWATYLRLRSINPAPYGAYFQFEGRCILSSSPERFVRVDSDGWAEAKPIKGTCQRFEDEADDEAARMRLRSDEKTRSENLMIVDLLRNDLGKVCDMGTVTVPSLMAVESYATLHQLVTTVRGKLQEGTSGLDCVRSLFPGGSMTGAPKLRSVELLDDLEPDDRGIYSGSIGYFSYCGQVDQSIVIRTIVWEGEFLSIGIGGALTIMSDAKSEYDETQLKAYALLKALGVTNSERSMELSRAL